MQTNNKNKFIKAFNILKYSINPSKDDFSVNFSSSYAFKFSAYILSSDCKEYNSSS